MINIYLYYSKIQYIYMEKKLNKIFNFKYVCNSSFEPIFMFIIKYLNITIYRKLLDCLNICLYLKPKIFDKKIVLVSKNCIFIFTKYMLNIYIVAIYLFCVLNITNFIFRIKLMHFFLFFTVK